MSWRNSETVFVPEDKRRERVVAFFSDLLNGGEDTVSAKDLCRCFFDPNCAVVWADFQKLVDSGLLEEGEAGWRIICVPSRVELEKLYLR